MKTLGADQLQLKVSDVYRAMGTMGTVGTGKKINSQLLQKIEAYRCQALDLLHCDYTCQVVPVNHLTPTHVVLQDSFSLRCNPLFFQEATQAAVILFTLGPAIEQEIKRLLVNSFLLDAFILDAYANTALDEFWGCIRTQLQKEVTPSGEMLGYSLCPGCILEVETQEIVFSILNKDILEMGIVLRDSYAMFPGKSCSYVIPIGKNLRMASQSRYACSICPSHHTCQFSPLGKAK